MAKEVVIKDDIDGTIGAQEVEFTWGGTNFTIDLTEENRKKFEDAIRPYLDKATARQAPTDAERRARAARPRQRASKSGRSDLAEVRAWAQANPDKIGDRKVGDRGRIHPDIVKAYDEAHP